MTEEQVTTSVETTDAMTVGIQAALTRIAEMPHSLTLIDYFDKATWKAWNAQAENAIVCDLDSMGLSDDEDEELLKAA